MLKFEWDEEKEWSNFLKHGLFFEDAQIIWTDPNALEFIDDDHSDFEERYLRVGLNPVRGILLVVFCERSERLIRIISARKATLEERKEYERQIRPI